MRTRLLITSILAVALSASLLADRIRLRSGKTVSGQFMSADSRVVRILLDNGQIYEYQAADVAAVEFAPRTGATAAAPAPDPAKPPQPVTLPAGTPLNVRLTQAIDVDSTQTGMTFRAVVDDPVMYAGKVVVPRNAAVVLQAAKIEQAGKMKGADKITLKANSLSFGGRKYDIVTAYVERKGEGQGKDTTKKTVAGAGLGAAVGAIAGGGSGAAIGAAVGGGAGTVLAASGTEHLKLPVETRLQFSLTAPISVQP